MGVHSAFLSLVTGDFTFDPDIQTHPSQGPNMYFLWIWRKSVQRFPIWFTNKVKKQKATDSANNRTLYSLRACGEKYKKEQKRVARSVEVKTLLKSSFLPNVTV